MFRRLALTTSLLAISAFAGNAYAQQHEPAGSPISAAERSAVIVELGKDLRKNYVFPNVAEEVAKNIENKAARDGYATATTTTLFAKSLTHDMRELGKDHHFVVFVDPNFLDQGDDDSAPSKEELDKERDEMQRFAFGIAKVERLPGNIGYLDLREFGPASFVSAAYTSAMSLLSGTDALILDLRSNGGGDPSSVAFLMSHFFVQGDDRHLNDLYFRPKDTTQQFWTVQSVGERYTKPVYVLISPRTFSGAEECAYDFQTQKRATLVGEVTGGGANPGHTVSIGHTLVAFVPTGRAINPITHTNWEHVGVQPDIAVPAAQAQQTAYVALLKVQVQNATEPGRRDALKALLARVEKGESEKVDYTRFKD
jgi:hypothetical protein